MPVATTARQFIDVSNFGLPEFRRRHRFKCQPLTRLGWQRGGRTQTFFFCDQETITCSGIGLAKGGSVRAEGAIRPPTATNVDSVQEGGAPCADRGRGRGLAGGRVLVANARDHAAAHATLRANARPEHQQPRAERARVVADGGDGTSGGFGHAPRHAAARRRGTDPLWGVPWPPVRVARVRAGHVPPAERKGADLRLSATRLRKGRCGGGARGDRRHRVERDGGARRRRGTRLQPDLRGPRGVQGGGDAQGRRAAARSGGAGGVLAAARRRGIFARVELAGLRRAIDAPESHAPAARVAQDRRRARIRTDVRAGDHEGSRAHRVANGAHAKGRGGASRLEDDQGIFAGTVDVHSGLYRFVRECGNRTNKGARAARTIQSVATARCVVDALPRYRSRDKKRCCERAPRCRSRATRKTARAASFASIGGAANARARTPIWRTSCPRSQRLRRRRARRRARWRARRRARRSSRRTWRTRSSPARCLPSSTSTCWPFREHARRVRSSCASRARSRRTRARRR